MINKKLVNEIVEEIKNDGIEFGEVKMMIEDLAMEIKEENESVFADETVFMNNSFSLEVKKIENINTVILNTTYSNQEIDDKFIEEMKALNTLKNELNKYSL